MTNSGMPRPVIHSESGQIVILTAVAMVALLGIAALSLDASYMYDLRNRMHAAADAAAKSAAIEVIRNPTASQATLEAFADQQVAWQGFSPTRLGGTTSVVVNHAPGPLVGPNFIGNPHYVEVIVSETKSTFFANILGFANMTPRAMAIAGAGNPSACVVINRDLTIGNSGAGIPTLTMNGCGVAVGGNIIANNPGATIDGTPTPSVAVTGTCIDPWDACTDMGILTTGAPTPTDPLSTLVFPSSPGGCIPGVGTTLGPGCYTSIASTVTSLQSGSYYITGTVDIGTSLTGSGVTLFLTGAGHLTSGNNNALHLTAPTSGSYTGVAIFQDRTDSNNFDTGNRFTIDVSGAIYMPGTDVNFPNALSFSGTNCTLFIARSLTIKNGSGTMSNSGCASVYGGALFLSVSIAQ